MGRRKLSKLKQYVRSRYMVRYAAAELADYLAAMRDDDGPEGAAEDGGGDSDLFFEALDRAEAGPTSLVVGPIVDDDDEAGRRPGVC